MTDDSHPYTPEELAALEATAEKATPGERDSVLDDGADGAKGYIIWSGAFGQIASLWDDARPEHNWKRLKDDAKFYAAFTPDVAKRLIHQLRQQTARAERAETKYDEAEGDYVRVAKAALEAGPLPASERPGDDQLEPPWDVLTRMKQERDAWKARAEAAERERDLPDGRRARELQEIADLRAERDAAHTALAIMDSRYKECQWELEARTAAYNLADRERDAYQEQLSDARTVLAAAGWCEKHRPGNGVVYASCWRCSRQEESAALAAAEAEILHLRATIGFDRT